MLFGFSGSSGSPPRVSGGVSGLVTVVGGGGFVASTGGGVLGVPSVTSADFWVSVLAQPARKPSMARLKNSFFILYRSLSWVFDQRSPRRFTHVARLRAESLAHAAIARYRG